MLEACGLEYRIYNDLEKFNNTDGFKINYSDVVFENTINIKPHNILFDHGIRDYHLEVQSHPTFYKIFMKGGNQPIPFDLFGASFWLLSRYEEYLPYKGDIHQRFSYRSSLAYQYEFIQIPLVNLWIHALQALLKEKYKTIVFSQHDYKFLSSIDIDNAYKYKYKGFVRTLAGILSDKSLRKIKERFKIILGLKADPFDCYQFLIEQHKQLNIKALYFILLGDYGPNDKNHSATDLRFQSLIKHLKDYSDVGIHPSFGSNANVRQLKVEVNRLTNITHSIITQSRQHFSMLKFPGTYQNLLQASIYHDYSMGYTNYNGFRASYCFPYKWYNLDIEASSTLTLHSFCISENTLMSNTKRNYEAMLKISEGLINEVKKYNGECISIFHNDNFNHQLSNFYVTFLRIASHKD